MTSPPPKSSPEAARSWWVRCPVDGKLHRLAPLDVETASAEGSVSALCGQRIALEWLTLPGRAWPRCESCVAVVSARATAGEGGQPR